MMADRHARIRGTTAFLGSAAVHLGLAVTVVLVTSGDPAPLDSAALRIAVVVPSLEEQAPVTAPDLQLDPADRGEPIDDVPGSLSVDGIDVNVERIRARRDALFPFLTADMVFLDQVTDQFRPGESALVIPGEVVAPTPPVRLPPLRLTDRALQSTVDRAWSRRSRWKAFGEIAGLLRTHDADTGQAPVVLRAYLDQNLLQLFCDDGTRTARFWAMVENAAEHVDFVEFVREFTRDHPSSLATTELLLLLDKLTQASRDTLLLLVGMEPDREAMSSARAGHELARTLQAHYRVRLEQRQLHSSEDIVDWYNALRLRILSAVVATSLDGYRVSDARFLIGQIHFERGDLTEATRWWREIRPDPRDSYVQDYSRLLDELQWPGGARERQITYILNAVSSRWRVSSLERLRRFGGTCDSY
jgi:hypothetical protein